MAKQTTTTYVQQRLNSTQKKRNFNPQQGAKQIAGIQDHSIQKDFGRFDELCKLAKALKLDVNVQFNNKSVPVEEKETVVYFANESGTFNWKVGFSTTPKNRTKALQTGNSHDLNAVYTIPGDKILEGNFHKYLWHYNIKGRSQEWFVLNNKIIKALLKRYEEDKTFLIKSNLLKDQKKKLMPR